MLNRRNLLASAFFFAVAPAATFAAECKPLTEADARSRAFEVKNTVQQFLRSEASQKAEFEGYQAHRAEQVKHLEEERDRAHGAAKNEKNKEIEKLKAHHLASKIREDSMHANFIKTHDRHHVAGPWMAQARENLPATLNKIDKLYGGKTPGCPALAR